MARLDQQRPPSKFQKPTARKYVRGYDVNPRTPWGTTPTNADVAATGATPGAPGTWTPSGATAPENVANLIAGVPKTVTSSTGAVSWTVGQYVQTQTASTPGRAHWNGTAWVAGAKL